VSSAERALFNPSTGPWSFGTCPGPFVLGHLVLYGLSTGPRTEGGLSTGPKDQGRQVQGPGTKRSGHGFRRGFQSSAPSRWEIASAQTARLAMTPGAKSNQYWSPVQYKNPSDDRWAGELFVCMRSSKLTTLRRWTRCSKIMPSNNSWFTSKRDRLDLANRAGDGTDLSGGA